MSTSTAADASRIPTNGHVKPGLFALTLGAVGVVYGDIGTSPLYALREALLHASTGGVTREEVIGVVSLLLWALILIVTVKYVFILLRLDNKGQGGTLSLLALIQGAAGRRVPLAMMLAVAACALFYGDAVITPAISVLSAVEGLKLVTPVFEPYILPITIGILACLFFFQYLGTASVAAFFGPVTAAWFLVMGALGLSHVGDDPGILAALNPVEGALFLARHGLVGAVVMGSVFLAVTGAEALYADMGHFGRKPIRLAWLALVLPCLVLNYLGQGALILADPAAASDPFFLMCPEWALAPVVLLATMATVIASQAVITGAFSITQQAIQLGFLPRFEIRYTSAAHDGQIYLPRVNVLLFVGVVILVTLFGSSSSLASAYGIAVTADMVIASVMALLVLHHAKNWPLPAAAALMAPFLIVESSFLAANLLKLLDGGFVPILFAGAMALLILTWVKGNDILNKAARDMSVPLVELISHLDSGRLCRAPNTAVFLTADPDTAPTALLHNIKHNHVLHEQNVILTMRADPAPYVADAERIEITRLDEDFAVVKARFGYMETPTVPKILILCRKQGLKLELMSTSFFLSKRSLRAVANYGLPMWRANLFIRMFKSATAATDFYRVPHERVVELGQQYVV